MCFFKKAAHYMLYVFLSFWVFFLFAVLFFYSYDFSQGIHRPYGRSEKLHERWPELGLEWKMHPVDNPGDWLPNGLDSSDVDGDGLDDYLTNYEFRGRIRIALHPGTGKPSGSYWPAVDVGKVPNAESSAFGDLDGDGHADVVAAHGIEHTRQQPGIRIFWADHREDVLFFTDGGGLDASMGGWHFHYVRTMDVDGDGYLDIIAGGRTAVLAGTPLSSRTEDPLWAGIRWFQNPGAGQENIRDLSQWEMFEIDAHVKSGHGFVFGDIDGDGLSDLALCNSDWDTPDEEKKVLWYRNPGPGQVFAPWPSYEVFLDEGLYAKEQAAVTDIDGDGRQDILLFWNKGMPAADGGVLFETARIEKHPATQWRSRPLITADIDGNGKMDLVGALIHKNGYLPSDKAALFLMEHAEAGWKTHVIKWGDAFLGLGTFNGEKWDQLIAADIDGDGDLDIIANCEEYNRLRSIVSVVWFENPGGP